MLPEKAVGFQILGLGMCRNPQTAAADRCCWSQGRCPLLFAEILQECLGRLQNMGVKRINPKHV